MVSVPGNNINLGQVVGQNTPVVLPTSARKQHVYICGGTGVGKSKLLEHMIRQDILEWSRTKCGLILIDPHGSIFDNLMTWLADPRNKLDRPIIPIDLRNERWAVSYNMLRQRPSVNTSVIVDNFVEAMAHVWGENGTTNTPLFARNARMVLRTLYEGHFTLSDVVHLMDSGGKQVRQAMAAKVHDPVARRHWREVDQLSTRDFIDRMSSTLNRLERFVGHELFRAILGQPDESLDLYQAMEDGAIILVSLATEEGKISEENAHTFGTLLLSDLWTAAKMRRKANNPKPFYVYLDEFQEFITPTIAKSLDQARGFGLCLTMSHQFPLQLKNSGEHGQRLYDSVMENASSKIIFRLQNIENLTPLAHSLFMGVLDPDEVKHRLYSTKVMGYEEEIQEDISRSTTHGRGGASHDSNTRSEGEGGSESRNFHDDPAGVLSSWNKCFSDASGRSESWMNSETESVTRRHVQKPIMGQELSSLQFRSIDEQLFRAMQGLFRQQDRYFAVRMVGQQAPLFAVTPDVRPFYPTPAQIKKYFDRQCKRWPFFLPLLEAQKRSDTRMTELPKILLAGEIEEATTANSNNSVGTKTVFVFKPRWFVLSQTEGAEYVPTELPEWSESRALITLNIERIEFTHPDGNCQGFARLRQVAVSPIAVLPHKTLFHELAHVVFGHTAEGLMDDHDRTPVSLREVEAECVALICCESLNLAGAAECRGYIQHWLAGQTIPDRSAQRIFKVADTILKGGYPTTVESLDE